MTHESPIPQLRQWASTVQPTLHEYIITTRQYANSPDEHPHAFSLCNSITKLHQLQPLPEDAGLIRQGFIVTTPEVFDTHTNHYAWRYTSLNPRYLPFFNNDLLIVDPTAGQWTQGPRPKADRFLQLIQKHPDLFTPHGILIGHVQDISKRLNWNYEPQLPSYIKSLREKWLRRNLR